MTVYPPLTAKDFELWYDDTHTYSFFEDENAWYLFSYGHDRDAEFAREANEYDIYAGEIDPEDATYTADDVMHYWCIVTDPDGERFTWKDVTAETPGAFPVSVISR